MSLKESQVKKEEDKLIGYMTKVQSRKKQVAEAQKALSKPPPEENAKERLLRIKEQQKDKSYQAVSTIKHDIQRRNQMVNASLAMKNEEHEQRKEITMLRKLDQQENYMRSKNFDKLYKQKLAERILEKSSRVNKSAFM